MGDLLAYVPSWLSWVGWLVVLAGYLMQRRAWIGVTSRIKTTIKGNQNQVMNTVHQAAALPSDGGESLLAQWSSWATILGLILTLLPLVKAWFPPTT